LRVHLPLVVLVVLCVKQKRARWRSSVARWPLA
jgi:hypothetical protein